MGISEGNTGYTRSKRFIGLIADHEVTRGVMTQHIPTAKVCHWLGLVIGFNQGGLAENPARGTGFWSQNTKGVARGILTEKARAGGWVFSQAQHPMIKTYHSMSLHCNMAIIVFKLLAVAEWKRQRADIGSRHFCEANMLLLRSGCLAIYIIRKLPVHSLISHKGCYRNWNQDWGHCVVTNDLGRSPQPEGEAPGLWWPSQVVGDTTITEIEVSISIISWCFKTY